MSKTEKIKESSETVAVSNYLVLGGVMKNRKFGQVMSFSRLFSFISFLSATLAWILSIYAVFAISVTSLVVSAALYIRDKQA
ncbi:hypothetical protein BCT86_02685 [Vibrio breoganii]|uniref:Uncharacterized protein n=1 Tax=Vibrio breoganii TaxID=553239 RepID=A0AAN0XXZ1_9VIBR|nr:hypothetical protein A6E01_15830 [Vibrio breoganii]PML04623.1 hypothetical protein BCT86_02685 [Vibrio breoganii]PMO56785.1 hypothetical protein BCT07_13950 [Vibrio breoganii]